MKGGEGGAVIGHSMNSQIVGGLWSAEIGPCLFGRVHPKGHDASDPTIPFVEVV
jgi:hypothetical protein